jgi:hypothetical protein
VPHWRQTGCTGQKGALHLINQGSTEFWMMFSSAANETKLVAARNKASFWFSAVQNKRVSDGKINRHAARIKTAERE